MATVTMEVEERERWAEISIKHSRITHVLPSHAPIKMALCQQKVWMDYSISVTRGTMHSGLKLVQWE